MTTWYVRPDTSHSGTRDGTSYEAAWGGWSAIVWGVGGVVGGDTLYVCGSHGYSSVITVGAHTGSSEATRCTIRGDYASDPGRITFGTASNYYLENSRNWTTIRDLAITAGVSNCLFISGGTNCVYSGNTLTASNSQPVSLWGSGSHSNVTITGNTIRGASNAVGSGSCLGWFVTTTAILRTLTNITISDNVFEDCSAGRSVIHIRTENDTDIGSVMTGMVVTGNTFRNCRGVLIEVVHGHSTSSIGGTLTVANNSATDCLESSVSAGIGGFMSLAGFSSAEVYENNANNIQGAAGFCNVFYGSFHIYNNTGNGIDTTTIDGNGLLFDHGCVNCRAHGNKFLNVNGKTGVANSGVGIMVLDATTINCYGNIVDGCKWGVHLGAAGSGQSCQIANNTIIGCTDGAVFTTATADLSNCTVKNNVFVGDGYSVYDQTAVAWSAENYNCFYGFASGTSNHTLGAQSSTTNPLLDASYRLTAASPCRGAGTYIAGARHFGGKALRGNPDIGAHRYFDARQLAAARLARASATTTTDRSSRILVAW